MKRNIHNNNIKISLFLILQRLLIIDMIKASRRKKKKRITKERKEKKKAEVFMCSFFLCQTVENDGK